MAQTSSLKAQERRRKIKQRAFARRRLRQLKGDSPLATLARPTPGRTRQASDHGIVHAEPAGTDAV